MSPRTGPAARSLLHSVYRCTLGCSRKAARARLAGALQSRGCRLRPGHLRPPRSSELSPSPATLRTRARQVSPCRAYCALKPFLFPFCRESIFFIVFSRLLRSCNLVRLQSLAQKKKLLPSLLTCCQFAGCMPSLHVLHHRPKIHMQRPASWTRVIHTSQEILEAVRVDQAPEHLSWDSHSHAASHSAS